MTLLRSTVLCSLLAMLACQTSEPPSQPAPAPAPAAPGPAAPKPAETTVATAAPVKLESVPAREDFEEEAEARITRATLERELQTLEKELSAD
jgi:hypothetical protein